MTLKACVRKEVSNQWPKILLKVLEKKAKQIQKQGEENKSNKNTELPEKKR